MLLVREEYADLAQSVVVMRPLDLCTAERKCCGGQKIP
jgi:hypothetical protein